MDTTTPSQAHRRQVIDRVRAARADRTPGRRRSSSVLAVRVGAAAPLPQGRVARALGRDPPVRRDRHPAGRRRARRWSRSSRPAALAAALDLVRRRGPAAGRRRPGADLPPPPPVGPRPGRPGAGLARPAGRPGDPRSRTPTPSPTPTGSSARSRTRSAWSTPRGWSTRPGSTTTPTALPPTRSTSSPGGVSGPGRDAAPRRPTCS